MSITTKTLRYEQIADVLRTQIRTGELEVGERLPSFIEMYDRHGATAATMKKVYDLLEKEELIERRSRSGIYVSSAKRTRSGVLTLVLPHFGNDLDVSYFMESTYSMRLLRGIHRQASELGFKITLCNDDQLLESPQSTDGVLLYGDTRMFEACAHLGKPLVSLISHPAEISSVGINDFESYKALTNHLLQLGHRNIAALLDSETSLSSYDLISSLRTQGYCAALEEAGIAAPPVWHRKLHDYTGDPSYANWGYAEMSQWLREGWRDLNCTALVTQNDSVAVGAIKALRQHGYRVPQDVSVTGFDGSGEDAHFDLKLTTMRVPLEEIGCRAVQLVDELLQNPQQEAQPVMLETQLIEGESAIKI